MPGIFPPSGEQNPSRARTMKKEEREYSWFCLEFCDAILRRRPCQLEALAAAANHLTALGYYADGLELDRRLAALEPDDSGILYNLSCSLALTGKTRQALECLERAIACGYSDYRHMSIDSDLASLRGDPRFGELLIITAEKPVADGE